MALKIHEAAMRYDLSATLWRNAMTQDNDELNGLNVEQLRMLEMRYPPSDQRDEIRRIITIRTAKEAHHGR